jgi:hypothetical protein
MWQAEMCSCRDTGAGVMTVLAVGASRVLQAALLLTHSYRFLDTPRVPGNTFRA